MNIKYIKSFLKTKLTSAGIWSFLIILIGTILLYDNTRYHDSNYYWSMGLSIFDSPNGFSFLNFPETFRGYLLPFILALLSKISIFLFDYEHFLFIVVNSIMFSFMIVKVMPTLFDNIKGGKSFFISSCIFSFFAVIFLNTHMINSLSDFPALWTFSIAIFAITKIRSLLLINGGGWKISLIFYSFLAGISLYSCYNIRAAYLYPAIALAGYLILIMLIKKRLLKFMISVLCIAIGITIVGLPQALINKKYTNQFSPKVMTEQLTGYTQSLEIAQIQWGLSFNYYIGYVGNKQVYPADAIKFENSEGEFILNEIQDFNFLSYLSLFLKHPGEMISLYFNHLIAYITPLYADHTFIRNLSSDTYFYFFSNAFIWIYFVIGLFLINKQQLINFIKKNGILLFLFALPSLEMLLGAPETRFFLSIYIIVYGAVCYFIDINSVYDFILSHPIKVILGIIIVLIVWISAINNLLNTAVLATGHLSIGGFNNSKYQIFNMIGSFSIPIFLFLIYHYYKKEYNIKKAVKSLFSTFKLKGVLLLGISTISIFYSIVKINKVITYFSRWIPIEYIDINTMLDIDNIELTNTNEQVQVIAFPIELKPYTKYRLNVTFEKITEVPYLLYFDLYGDNYDYVEQDMKFRYTSSDKTYTTIIDSGNIPKEMVFRIIYIGNSNYKIERLTFSEVEPK